MKNCLIPWERAQKIAEQKKAIGDLSSGREFMGIFRDVYDGISRDENAYRVGTMQMTTCNRRRVKIAVIYALGLKWYIPARFVKRSIKKDKLIAKNNCGGYIK